MKTIGYIWKDMCPDCGSDMQLRKSKYGLFYGCSKYPKCKSAHGAHKDGEPLGIPANKETKEWRIKAHDLFDKLWKEWGYSRKQSYKLLQNIMQMKSHEAHIGKFNIDQCKKLILKITERFQT